MNESELRFRLEQLHPATSGWALSCCARHPGLAEDVVQTVYLKVLQGKARFDGRAKFKTWLFAVVRRTAADVCRRDFLRQLGLLRFEQTEGVAGSGAGRAAAIEQVETQTVFRTALAALPRRQREVLHLVFYQDLTIQQAAVAMEVSLGSARTHYERGKRGLRELLGKSEAFHETDIAGNTVPAALR